MQFLIVHRRASVIQLFVQHSSDPWRQDLLHLSLT